MIALIPRWVWIAVAVVLALLGFQCWRSRGQDKTADRHVETSKAIDKAQVQLEQRSAKVDAVVDTVWLKEKGHKAASAVATAASDTAGQHAVTIRDTANMWHLRWQLRGVAHGEDSLALVAADLRADSLKSIGLAWHAQAIKAVASQDSLRDDLRVARTGCRLIPLVPCLSRKQTLVLGLASGAFAAWYVEEQRRKKDRAVVPPAVGVRITALRF